MSKKTFFFILIILIIALGWYFYIGGGNDLAKLEALKGQYPELTVYVDDVIAKQAILAKDMEAIIAYNNLGSAWKSLADWSRSAKVENYKDYYKKALDTYEAGVVKTLRRNTLFMANAGNMAKYIEDYELAENYYKEAISVAPGDETYYVLLAELYEYEMAKAKEEVLTVYEEGIKKMLSPGWLMKRRDSYLKRIK